MTGKEGGEAPVGPREGELGWQQGTKKRKGGGGGGEKRNRLFFSLKARRCAVPLFRSASAGSFK